MRRKPPTVRALASYLKERWPGAPEKLMIMSSFLMNPVSGAALPSSYQQPQHIAAGVVVDPKFPPSEEYSQSNYIPPGGDFFGGHHISQQQHHLQYGYHHQNTPSAYGASGVPITNGGYGAYGNYYHPQIHSHHPTPLHTHQIRPPIPLHPESQQPIVPCGTHPSHQAPQPPVSTSANLLQNLVDIPPSVSQQSDVNTSVCSPVSVGHGQESRGSPPGQQTLQELGLRLEDNVSDEQDDGDDDQGSSPVMDDDDDEEENGDRQIYPWMRKVHVAGAGKFHHNIELN